MNDEQLMLAVRGGSREAFETLFERYRDAIWRFYRRRIEDPGRAEELLQDVFLAVLQNSSRYEPRSPFRSYLFGVAFNALKAERRRAAQRQTEAVDQDVPAVSSHPDDSLWIRRALETLDADHREASCRCSCCGRLSCGGQRESSFAPFARERRRSNQGRPERSDFALRAS